MTSPAQTVRNYLTAFYAGDFATARALLADDFHFNGPAAHFHGADAFMKASAHAAAGTRDMTIERIYTDGDEVAAFYTLHLDHRVGLAAVAERYVLSNGLIAASTLIMDTAPFLNRRGGGEMAVDPVCHMDVDKAAAAAMHEYQGKAYYFCSTGCAEAFVRDPARYIAA